jgi:integrase
MEKDINKNTESLKSLRLVLEDDSNREGVQVGIRKDGKQYTVRDHKMSFFYPDEWLKIMNKLPTIKSKITAQLLVQTGARINEVRHIKKDDIDWERDTITLRVTKTKAKKGEKKGKPRTVPINSQFTKELKKHFKNKLDNELVGALSTSAFNIALKKAMKEISLKNYYMYSAHSIRKTHGNWLKIMGNLRLMNVDIEEICMRLGHDMNTFLKDYGSSGVMNNKDVMLIQKILGDLYGRK